MTRPFFVFLLILPVLFSTAQTKSPIQVTDMMQIKTLGNLDLAADGSKAAFTVLSIEPDTAKWEYKYVPQVWMTTMDGTTPTQLTFAKEGGTQPKWSPDGKQLAFVRTADGKPQIFVLNVSGGEAMQLTKFKYGATNPEWSKNGKQLLFTSTISVMELLADSILNPGKTIPAWPFEKPGFIHNDNLKTDTTKGDPNGNMAAIRNYLSNNEKDKKVKVLDKLNFQEESTTSSNIGLSHLFIQDAFAGATPLQLTPGFYSYNNAGFINDSMIVMDGRNDDTGHPDRSVASTVFCINKDGTGLRTLLEKDSITYTSGSVSPSGKWLAYTTDKIIPVRTPSFFIMPFNGKESERIEIPTDRNVSNMSWSRDEQQLYYTSTTNGGTVLSRYNLATKKIDVLTDSSSGITSYALDNNKLIFTKTSVPNPSELYIADAGAKNTKLISAFNTGWLKNKQLVMPEKHSFKNNKGMVVEYWVMKPANYEAGKKYPLLLEIHGGPAAMWGPGESSMWHEFQYFCARGYGVVYCNPRGSGGYGSNFLKGNVGDWGSGPTSDVLTALDKAVGEGWADTGKLMVSGGSYAGYLVAWIIAHDQRFKAASSQRGVYDLNTFFGEGNAWRLVPRYFGGYPWDPKVKQLLERESPINYVQNIHTPYLIFHGENDLRTGITQSEMLFKSLKVLGRPVEYVRHPGATHELTRSGNNRQRIDQLLRTYEFFERFVH